MDTRDLDLNLLVAFDALLREGSVSGAARRLGLSQPAMSYTLARLRTALGDALFVRVGNRMVPTPTGAEMGASVQRALRILHEEVLQRAPFDPWQAQRPVNLCITDVSEFTLLPRLVQHFARTAPGIELRLQSLSASELEAAMSTGTIDLALGHFPELHETLFQQTLYESDFVCIARRGNPATLGGLTLESLCAASHLAMKVRSQPGIIQRDLRALGIERRVKVTVQHFQSMAGVLAVTDLLAVVPREVAAPLAQTFEAEVHELPYRSSHFEVRQYWHERFHREPQNRWLRGEIQGLFQQARARREPTLQPQPR